MGSGDSAGGAGGGGGAGAEAGYGDALFAGDARPDTGARHGAISDEEGESAGAAVPPPWQPPPDHLHYAHYRHFVQRAQERATGGSRSTARPGSQSARLPPIAGAANDARAYSHSPRGKDRPVRPMRARQDMGARERLAIHDLSLGAGSPTRVV